MPGICFECRIDLGFKSKLAIENRKRQTSIVAVKLLAHIRHGEKSTYGEHSNGVDTQLISLAVAHLCG